MSEQTAQAQSLHRIFSSLTPSSCPSLHNFHMHTTCSDGRLKPAELIQQALSLGLQNLAITDHHSVDGFQAARSWLERQQWQTGRLLLKPVLWSGIEINARLLGIEVHILGYAFDDQHIALRPYVKCHASKGGDYDAQQVIAALHQAGGLVVLAHPCRYRVKAEQLIPAAAELGIDGVEGYYAYDNPSPWRPSPRQTQVVVDLAEPHGLLVTCGTDTHGRNLLQRI
ncbi:MAG: PHP domain-containing protein [Cyanobacteria bacterium P01_H01_bin.121]